MVASLAQLAQAVLLNTTVNVATQHSLQLQTIRQLLLALVDLVPLLPLRQIPQPQL